MSGVGIAGTSIASRPRLRLGPLTAVWRPRVVLVNAILAAATVVLFLTSIGIGEYQLSLGQVARVIAGGGSPIEQTIVLSWRMPRALAGVCAGASLALSGAITQSVTRNPLASPDILGITSGASVAAVAVIVFGGNSRASQIGVLGSLGVPTAALIGALAAGAIIWALAFRRGLDPFRLVIAGIVLSALLLAVQQWIMTKAEINNATLAQTWLTGSLVNAHYGTATPMAIGLLVALPVVAWIAFQLQAVALGDDAAASLGVSTNRAQTVMLLAAVALAALAVAATGPIGFVALVAPQAAQRLAGTATPPMVGSLLSGAALVIGADTATRTLTPTELPVGIITAVIGGVFLIYLLIRINRRTTL